MQVDRYDQIQMENGLHPAHSESRRLRREGVAKMMIGVPEKYALEVSSPTPIASERQHEQYLSVLDKLASKDNPTREEEKYAEVLNKKRVLNKTHIEKLSKRFKVSPAVFF